VDFATIFTKLINEMLNTDLEILEQDFYEKVVEYLRRESAVKHTVKIALSTLRVLFLIRLIKEISLIYRGSFQQSVSSLPRLEREVLEKVISALETLNADPQLYQRTEEKESVSAAYRSAGSTQARKREEKTLVFFLQPYPKIIDHDLSLGPFSKGDVAYLPKRLAKELVASGYAEEIPGELKG